MNNISHEPENDTASKVKDEAEAEDATNTDVGPDLQDEVAPAQAAKSTRGKKAKAKPEREPIAE
jgi:hypothetical protein